MKKLTSIILALALLLSVVSINVFAGAVGVGTQTTTTAITNVVSPGSGYNVVKIDPANPGTTARYASIPAEKFTSFGGLELGDDCWYIQPQTNGDYNNEIYIDNSKEWLSFELTRSADIYLMTNINPNGSSYMTWANGVYSKVQKDGQDVKITNAPGFNGARGGRLSVSVLKRTVEVIPGGSEKITMKGTGYLDTTAQVEYGVYGVIVDFKVEKKIGLMLKTMKP